jgi:hypothetical protein
MLLSVIYFIIMVEDSNNYTTELHPKRQKEDARSGVEDSNNFTSVSDTAELCPKRWKKDASLAVENSKFFLLYKILQSSVQRGGRKMLA